MPASEPLANWMWRMMTPWQAGPRAGTEDCEVNDMRLPEGIIVDVSAADAQRLIDAGHAELREAADPELSEEDAVLEEDAVSEDDTESEKDAAPESAEQADADEDIQEETGKVTEAEAAEAADDTVKAETAADETDADNEYNVRQMRIMKPMSRRMRKHRRVGKAQATFRN